MPEDKNEDVQELAARFIWLDKLFHDQMDRDNVSSALSTVKEGAKVAQKLDWLMGVQGALVASDGGRDFVAGKLNLQQVIKELDLDVSIWDSESDWGFKHGWIADSHLNSVLDVTDPGWVDRVNKRLLEVTVLITARTLPEWVLRHLRALRRCYALELHDVAWISLRSLIETASYSRLYEEHASDEDAKVLLFAERRLQTCLEEIARRSWVSHDELIRVREIVLRTNSLVHAKKTIDVPNSAETLQAIRTVISYLHCLLR